MGSESLPPPDVDPAISAAARAFYLAYLNSPAWRAKRNHALRRVDFRCQRCDSKRDLQVHHLTYNRLGAERDSDLEVLCAYCHRAEHLEHPEQTSLGVYLTLASEAVLENRFASIADLSESVKRRCIALKIPVQPTRIHDALAVVCGNRLRTQPPQTVAEVQADHGRALTPDETRDVWCRLSLGVLLKPMPPAGLTATEQLAHEDKVRAQADVFRQLPKPREKRRPIMDRLAEIFR